MSLKSDQRNANEQEAVAHTRSSLGRIVVRLLWRLIVVSLVVILLAVAGLYTLVNWDTGPTWFVHAPEKALATDSLAARGKKLRLAIDWEYSQLAKTNIFYEQKGSGRADISSVISAYIPVGTSVLDAKEILKYAGLGGVSKLKALIAFLLKLMLSADDSSS